MNLIKNNGFIIILVTVALSVLILSAAVIISIGCSELIATRVRNDLLVSAYYVAISGCERMYAYQKTLTNPSWNTPRSGTLSVGSHTIGSYVSTAYDTTSTEANTFTIVSSGTVNGHTAIVTVKLGYMFNYNGPLAVGAYGPVTLISGSTQASIKMEGPAASHETVTVTPGGRIDISGDPQTIDGANLPKVTFWLGTPFDTNNDGSYAVDTDSNGVLTRAEAIAQEKEDVFNSDNVYNSSDNEITGKDAFCYYYTTYLNYPGTLYYTGDQLFDSNDIDDSVPMIFVDGNCTITDNDGATTDHTVVVTGNLMLQQPTNGPGDRNTYVVYGTVTTDGVMGHGGGTRGDLIIFANGDISKTGGSKMNVSFYTNGALTINTGTGQGSAHLMLSRLTEGGMLPVGLPPGYPTRVTDGFTIKNQTDYPPVWQRN